MTAETRAAGAIARGNAARAPIQVQINASIAQAEQRLVGGVSNRVARTVRLDIRATRGQGQIDSQAAFDAARSAYATQRTTTTLTERALLGGGDPDLAVLRVTAQAAARGFSSTSSVGVAAAKAHAQYLKAVSFTGTSNVSGAANTWSDLLPVSWYDDWKERFVTRSGGDL